MKIAFVLPSPSVLKHDWYRDLLWQKVGVPNLAGYLKRAGFPDITQYDFNNQVLKAYEASPSRVRLMLYADDKAVAGHLRSGDPALGKQTAYFADALGIEEHDLFGISLSNFLGDTREIALGINLAKCLAKELKRRFPRCKVMLGGMQNMSIAFQRTRYRRILRDCGDIDFAVCGEAHVAILELCEALRDGRPFRSRPKLRAKKINNSLLIQAGSDRKGAEAQSLYFVPLPADKVKDPSVPFGFPAYDKENSRAYSYTGREVREFYHLPASLKARESRVGPDNYLTLHVSFSEGCRFNCYFCTNAGVPLFCLDLDESIRILKLLKEELGCRHFLFYNPNFNPTYSYAKSFLEKIIKADLNLLWADCFNLSTMDTELISLMKEAGVMKIIAGVEYPTPRMLKYINKGITTDRINRNLEDLHKAGIWNHVLLITGMPTETWQDVKELEAWLTETKDLVNSYTVGSFHMAEGSPFHRNPAKFGFRLKKAIELYCQTAFDEKDGLKWEDKDRQNQLTNRHVRSFIDAMKGSTKPTRTRMDDSPLLMYLYRVLGHGKKAEIERLYEAAYTVNPHIPAAYAHLRAQLARPSSPLNSLLKSGALELSPGAAARDHLGFTLEKNGSALSCSVQARSEDVLINPAKNLVHGDFFILKYEPRPPAPGGKRDELNSLLSGIRGRLKTENIPSSPDGELTVLLLAAKGSARFRFPLSSRPPSFACEPLKGSLDKGLLRRVGGLVLEASFPEKGGRREASGVAELQKRLPAILKIVENWEKPRPARKRLARSPGNRS